MALFRSQRTNRISTNQRRALPNDWLLRIQRFAISSNEALAMPRARRRLSPSRSLECHEPICANVPLCIRVRHSSSPILAELSRHWLRGSISMIDDFARNASICSCPARDADRPRQNRKGTRRLVLRIYCRYLSPWSASSAFSSTGIR